jgi:nitroreductase
MEFYKVMKTRRSVRNYRSDPIPEDVMNNVMNAVRMAPSGSNKQPWKFILVKDPELKDRLQKASNNQIFIGEAPAAIVACGYDVSYNRGGYMGEMTFLVDVSIAFTHLVLAARAEGLGTCWLGDFENKEVKELLDVPDDWNVVAVTPIGYPRDDAFVETDRRKPLSEIYSEDKF